jgi:tetratricopeptide (TPR) repeat protein
MMITKPSTVSLLILAIALRPPAPSKGQDAQSHLKAGTKPAVELLMLAREAAKEVEDREEHDVSMGDIAQDLGKLGETIAASGTFELIIDGKWHDYTLKPFLERQLQAKQLADGRLTVGAMRTAQGKAEALCALASAQRESGHRNNAKKSLTEAERIFAENRNELTNVTFLEQLALTQDELGEASRARDTRREIAKLSGGYGFAVDKFDMSWLTSQSGKLRESARAEMKNGDLTAARASLQHAANEIESVPNVSDRAILLYMIASDQVSAGAKDEARNTFLRADERAENLPGASRDLILRDVVTEQAAAGYIEESLQAVENIRDNHLKWQALHGIAVSQTKQIGVESGLKTTEQIQSESERDVTLVDMAQVLGKQNELPQIYRVVNLIHSPYMKSRSLIEAAEAISGISTPD